MFPIQSPLYLAARSYSEDSSPKIRVFRHPKCVYYNDTTTKENHVHDNSSDDPRSSTAGNNQESAHFADSDRDHESQRDHGTTDSRASRAACWCGRWRLLRIFLFHVFRECVWSDGQGFRYGWPESLC